MNTTQLNRGDLLNFPLPVHNSLRELEEAPHPGDNSIPEDTWTNRKGYLSLPDNNNLLGTAVGYHNLGLQFLPDQCLGHNIFH